MNTQTIDWSGEIRRKSEERISKNQEWAKSPEGKEAREKITKEPDPKDCVRANLMVALRSATLQRTYLSLQERAKLLHDAWGEDIKVLTDLLSKYE